MNFLEAVKEMKKGMRAKRKQWGTEVLTLKKGSFFYRANGSIFTMSLVEFEATDWEVIEKKKETLSDNVKQSYSKGDMFVYEEDDIKETVKEFVDFAKNTWEYMDGFSGDFYQKDIEKNQQEIQQEAKKL